MLGRRRPLLRAAMVGGAGYVAGRNIAERTQHEAAQDEEMAELQRTQSTQYAPDAPAAPGPSAASSVSERADALVKLKGLLDSGVLTQEEFDSQKRQILQGG
jgi:hypothetical protein